MNPNEMGTTRMRPAGSMFVYNLDYDDPDVWLDASTYCLAMEPLLRIAARDAERFADLTGQADKPQVPRGCDRC